MLQTYNLKRFLALAVSVIVLLAAVAYFATLPMLVATCAYLLLIAGLWNRSHRQWHARLMTAGIILDLVLVLTLQVSRSAIQTALSFSLSPLQQAHIGTSTIATILYFPVLFLGLNLYKGRIQGPRFRALHIRLGVLAFIFRTLGFLLMFSLLARQNG